MATSGQKGGAGAIAGAGAGAKVGAAVGGPAGAVVGGVIGGIGGFLFGSGQGDDYVPVAPTFADISLAREHPDLFKRLQQKDEEIKARLAMYNARRQGPTAQEARDFSQGMEKTGENINRAGLSGSSESFAIADEQRRRAEEQIADRIFREKAALYNAYTGATDQGYGMHRELIGDVMGQKNKQFEADTGSLNASNANWSGIANSGLSNLGGAFNIAKDYGRAVPNYGGGQPLPPGYGQPIIYSGVPGGQYSDMYAMNGVGRTA